MRNSTASYTIILAAAVVVILFTGSIAYHVVKEIRENNAALREAVLRLRFQPGQYVESVLTGQRGQVIERGPWGYIVRFKTADGFSDVTMREFELRG